MEFMIGAWDVPEVTPVWVGNSISRKFPYKEVVSISVSAVSCASSPCSGTFKRIQAHFSDGTTQSFVLKLQSESDVANEYAVRTRSYESEYNFYSYLRDMSKARVPQCYFASLSPSKNAITLLLEDLSAATTGDMKSMTMASIEAAVVALAQFHGSFFDNSSIGCDVQSAAQFCSTFDPSIALSSFLNQWGDLLRKYSDESTNKVVETVEHCASHYANWPPLLEMMGCVSVVHGNYNPSNLMFSSRSDTDDMQAIIVDFQTIYRGGDVARACDLNYLLVANLSQDSRLASEGRLISRYLEVLSKAVSSQMHNFIPSVEEFTMYYRMATQAMVYRCLSCSAVIGEVHAEEVELKALVSRSLDAVVDHELHQLLAVGRH